MLRAEIARLEAELEAKGATKSAAEALFRRADRQHVAAPRRGKSLKCRCPTDRRTCLRFDSRNQLMFATYRPILSLLRGTAFLLAASGLHGLLLPLRGQLEGFLDRRRSA